MRIRVVENMELLNNRDVGNVHLLGDSWKLWYWRFDGDPTSVDSISPQNWLDSLHGLCKFDSVEKFWSVFNHIKPPSMLKIGCDYSVFKSDIKPMWEDEANKNGGHWLIKDNGLLDQCWIDILLSIIGGMYEPYNEQICGVVYKKRQCNKLYIWISTCDTNIVNNIGSKLKQYINYQEKIKFHKHNWDSSLKKKSTWYRNTTLDL